MLTEKNTNIERIIAKIDNDFNPDNSDWIPRVGAWCIDAMSQLKVIPTETIQKRIKVNNRIAYVSETISDDIKVYDCNGCEIKNLKQIEAECRCNKHNNIPTGELTNTELSNTMSQVQNQSGVDEYNIATEISGTYPVKHDVHRLVNKSNERNYLIIDNHQIELNFDTDCIVLEYQGIKTFCSEEFGCELPVIPNNGTLIEAIVYYCMYKMLCRGYKHQVFNLSASQYGTNPYYMWIQLKDQAKRSVINDGVTDNIDKIWRSAMFIKMFDPRR